MNPDWQKSDFLYKKGRRPASGYFISKPFIYRIPENRQTWEEKARTNLQKELETLSK